MSGRVYFRLRHELTGLYMDCRTPGRNFVEAKPGQRVTLQPRRYGAEGHGQKFYSCSQGNPNIVYSKFGLVLATNPLEDILTLGVESLDSDTMLHFKNDGRIGVGENHVTYHLVPEDQTSGSLIVVKERIGLGRVDEVWKKVPSGDLSSNCGCM